MKQKCHPNCQNTTTIQSKKNMVRVQFWGEGEGAGTIFTQWLSVIIIKVLEIKTKWYISNRIAHGFVWQPREPRGD